MIKPVPLDWDGKEHGGSTVSDLIISTSADEDDEDGPEALTTTYEATQEDEEKFLLMYWLHFSLSEADACDQERRRWLLGRFMAQKNMERQVMANNALLQRIGPEIRGDGPRLVR